MKQIKSTDVSNFFSNIHLDDGGNDYVSYHSKRFAEIINLIEKYKSSEDVAILDIGPAFQTMLIKEYNKQAHVDTLGYEFGLIEYKEDEKHYFFDLNKSQNETEWISLPRKYDIIVFSEVIEHLYTSPRLVLNFVKTLLKENGILILQTPNAVTLPYRFLMLIGRNPFMLISENVTNPAHFREYTLREMKQYLTSSNYEIVAGYRKNYFYRPNWEYKIFLFVCRFLPSSFRQGLTIVAKPNY